MTNEAAECNSTKKNILICDTQPVAVEGMKWLIENSGDLVFAGSVTSLDSVYALLHPEEARLAAEAAAAEAAMVEEMPVAELSESVAAQPMETACVDSAPAEPEVVAISEAVAEALPVSVAVAPMIMEPVDAVVIDKALGMAGVMELLHKLTGASHPVPAVVWGSISEAEALKLLQAGARGILRRTSESGTLLTCLRAVTIGGTWMEDGIFGSTDKLFNPRRSQLTSREREVVVLVEKGLRNRDIARLLGIQTGTVKIHLKHIFEKTGVRGRYGLAFTGLQNKGSIPMTAPNHFTAKAASAFTQ